MHYIIIILIINFQDDLCGNREVKEVKMAKNRAEVIFARQSEANNFIQQYNGNNLF